MKTVSITRLKATLSAHIARVRDGETLVVTDRGRPVARIVAVEEEDVVGDPDLLRLERQGLLRRGLRPLSNGFFRHRRPEDRTGALRRSVIDEREGGW